jgi:NADH-quinone oxidoreductase subunit H
LVAGFNIEYSGLKFGMFYVADFLHAFTSALVFTTIFLGGWQGPAAESIPILGFLYLMLKTLLVYVFMLILRFTLPRFRIDQMMNANWKLLTPLSLATLVVTAFADKLLSAQALVIRLGGLWAANVILWLAADRFITILKRPKQPGFIAKKRPVARPEPESSVTVEPGGQA